MSTIELIKLIDLAWEEGFSIAHVKPCLDKGYIHFTNSVFNELIVVIISLCSHIS